jgi:APA family basic amino acid/polyamine antiporter
VSGLRQPLWQWVSGADPTSYGVTGVLVAAAVVFFAYSGFEAVANLGEETKDPAKDMPRGLLGTLAICTALYVLVCFVITGMVRYSHLSEGAPISDAFDQVGMGWASVLIAVAAVAGLSSVILVDIVAMGRIGFALCRDRLLPEWIGGAPDLAHAVPGHDRHHRCRGAAGRVRPPQRARRDGQHRHAVRLLRRVARGDHPAPNRAADAASVPHAAGARALPLVSAVCCVALMSNLALETWLRFLVWLVVGLGIYWLYGRSHSRLETRAVAGQRRTRAPLRARR